MSHTPTILVTGSSSGFGLETSRLFLERGWRVIATMRSPRADLLPASSRLTILPLDVADPASRARCLAEAGPVDALVNNAGVGLMAPVEGLPMELIRELFDTNVLGTIAMTQGVIPAMRERGAGVVVNVTSVVAGQALPLLSAYSGSKAAVEAFTRSLAFELAPWGIRLRLVQPGRAPGTAFGGKARERLGGRMHPAYAGFVQQLMASRDPAAPVTEAADVAEAVWQAVTDPASPMALPAGADALALAAA